LDKNNALRIAVLASAIAIVLSAVLSVGDPIHAASPQASPAPADPGADVFAKRCALCHGAQRQGNPPTFPALSGVTRRMTDDQITALIHTGKNAMPPAPDIKGDDLAALLKFLATPAPGTNPAPAPAPPPAAEAATSTQPPALAQAGEALFRQNCSFCHGRDAEGGETGPDLTRSKLVLADKTGEQIAAVIREGRPNGKMPGFKFSEQDTLSVIAFIRVREAEAVAHPGGRRGVDVADLQTGNAEAGKQYFNGAGGCSKCHSPTGDLAGLATRLEGLRLELRMLYPWPVKSTVTVTLPGGQTVSGELAYRDEFTIALRDASDTYRSWSTSRVTYKIDTPADAHAEQLPKYTDADVHNLMAYLQTLR
jgi:cytochrome c oxidase cbb3-type subunit 3